MIRILLIVVSVKLFLCSDVTAQTEDIPYASNTTKENRSKEYHNLVNYSIYRNLSLTLTDSTEENWQDAFYAMELINYRSPEVDAKVISAFDAVEKRSTGFKRAFLELVYTVYPDDFVPQILSFVKQTDNPKLFAIGSEYLFLNNRQVEYETLLLKRMDDNLFKLNDESEDPFFAVLRDKLLHKQINIPPVADFLTPHFLPDETILFSFQRKNRNYPGLVMVRGKDGLFAKADNGNYFFVPQLARSINNMPGYLTNGNTPQGILKMTGFDVSKSIFIGPTTNIQMVLPYERSSEVADSITQSFGNSYQKILPDSWKNYYPVYEAYYAGKAGRTEIIAHGTTVNPEYYKNQPYYPLTPTQGCLCTKEIWSNADGKRIESDQQKLVNAVKEAGGANGYCIVIEIDDKQNPVSLQDILPYLNQKIK
jgi:hypothetical protein